MGKCFSDEWTPFMGYYDLSYLPTIERVAPKHGVSFDVRASYGKDMVRLLANERGNKSPFWRELYAELDAQGISHPSRGSE